MRILIVAGYLGSARSNPWLLDDLAIAFAQAGDEVDVLVHDTKHGRLRGKNSYPDERIGVFSVGPRRPRKGKIGKIVNYVIAGWGLHTTGFRFAKARQYDLCLYTSIAAFSWGLPGRLRRASIARKLVLILWDFFPIHQLEIGRIRQSFLERPMRAIEGMAMRNADVIAVMSPANERYLRRYHPRLRASTVLIPPWVSDPGPPSASEPRRSRFTVMFGGQLAAGRGVDTLLEAMRLLQDQGLPIDLLILGEGPAKQELADRARRLDLQNTTFGGLLLRSDYRKNLMTVHVGVAVTVAGVSAPSFPSKIAEYCACALPVVVCVEKASDAGEIVESAGAGLAVPAGDAKRLAGALAQMYAEHLQGTLEARGDRARSLFEEKLSATRAAEQIHAIAGGD